MKTQALRQFLRKQSRVQIPGTLCAMPDMKGIIIYENK